MLMRTGAVRPIVPYGHMMLHQPCVPADSFGTELAELIDDMFASMYAADGVGLTANQIGAGLRVFVYDCPDATGARQAGHIVNPVLRIPVALASSATEAEGCLSIPGQYAEVTRPVVAAVTGLDRNGRELTFTGTGVLARCLQHEVDHLDGTVYVDPATGEAARRGPRRRLGQLNVVSGTAVPRPGLHRRAPWNPAFTGLLAAKAYLWHLQQMCI